ncbi:DUF262 domain-containing protein [Photobacterium leiognathi]|uniref:DUF262 domain-containing protein n=1 Tax=Photobacterium leiognathi TaxID=553611 RepID=UPI0002088E58|nr:DUF262 domain-containing protein [Photobacterium leiognathi]PSW47863.1 DUF262 domain-containing protein [Photobacterium leiognathi subsp. mandapamensis]GAA06980.1 conserved hypothetical protein [Photobacterium leiognathi subsp. mandapamensis svers.1.1.]
MDQISPSVTNPTIAMIYNEIKSGALILQPEFQRKFVWTVHHQDEFLETITHGLPFPEIYVSEGSLDVDKMITTRNILDGQQRLTTIYNYIDGKIDGEGYFTKVKPFSELTKEEKTKFISYKVVVRDLGKIDDDVMRDVFRRINLTNFSLEAIEIQNAIYNGEFIHTAKKISENFDLSKFSTFPDAKLKRMSDVDFILLVMSTVENGGYFAQDKMVEDYISRYNDFYKKKDLMFSRILKTFALIESMNLKFDSMWFRKSNFFTLVCEMIINEHKISDNFKEKIVELEESVMAGKLDSQSPYNEYYMAMYQGTNNRGQRVVRSRFIREKCLN